jgi:hypothetical protein
MYKNLKKARSKWALISRPLLKTGVSERTIGYFYKAIVQSVLLYGSETWTVNPQMLQVLEGFHHQIARRITNKMPYLHNDHWIYPDIAEALAEAGLYPIAEYIHRQQTHIADYIATRPILDHCTDTPDISNSRLYRWWNQPLLTRAYLHTDSEDTGHTGDTDHTNEDDDDDDSDYQPMDEDNDVDSDTDMGDGDADAGNDSMDEDSE